MLEILKKGRQSIWPRKLVRNSSFLFKKNVKFWKFYKFFNSGNENIAKILIENRINDGNSAALLSAITLGDCLNII